MKALGKFILLDLSELEEWLNMQIITREISLIQHHHTYFPAYQQFNNENHFDLCISMENYQKEHGFSEIAQNFTTFPDGKIIVCRDINKIPAGIKGANSYGICIENVGNFDLGHDLMSPNQRETIISITKAMLNRFSLIASDQSVVYHHWYDLTLGIRISEEGTGTTKSCPGTNFFGGNTIESFNSNFLPLL